LDGQVLEPGVYNADAALALTGTLTLKGATMGRPAAILSKNSMAPPTWTFIIGGAFTTGADSEMVIEGAGSSENVHWEVAGAITLGAASAAIGDMTSTEGAITVGAGATCGNLAAPFGAISVGAGITTQTGNISAGGAITIGAGASIEGCEGSGCPLE
jgi:hypothetical protein